MIVANSYLNVGQVSTTLLESSIDYNVVGSGRFLARHKLPIATAVY
jgi:hypothetical protein